MAGLSYTPGSFLLSKDPRQGRRLRFTTKRTSEDAGGLSHDEWRAWTDAAAPLAVFGARTLDAGELNPTARGRAEFIWSRVPEYMRLEYGSPISPRHILSDRPRSRPCGRRAGRRRERHPSELFQGLQIFDDRLAVLLGPAALGYYSVGYKVFKILVDVFTKIVSKVALPAFAELQSKTALLAKACDASRELEACFCHIPYRRCRHDPHRTRRPAPRKTLPEACFRLGCQRGYARLAGCRRALCCRAATQRRAL